jgi:hypothetical protein
MRNEPTVMKPRMIRKTNRSKDSSGSRLETNTDTSKTVLRKGHRDYECLNRRE